MGFKWALFGFEKYDAAGGFNDLQIAFNVFDEAKKHLEQNVLSYEYWQLVDLESLTVHNLNNENLQQEIAQIVKVYSNNVPHQ